MQCNHCGNTCVTIIKCPINYIPKRLEYKTKSLCKTEYTFKQPIADAEIEPSMTIIPEQYIFAEESYCSYLCIEMFLKLDINVNNYTYSKSMPILYIIKNKSI